MSIYYGIQQIEAGLNLIKKEIFGRKKWAVYTDEPGGEEVIFSYPERDQAVKVQRFLNTYVDLPIWKVAEQ